MNVNVDPHVTDGIAPWVWEQREMRAALASRDLKQVYERLQRVGVSQRRIASLTGQSASEIYEVLKGRRVMAYDVLARIADGLGVPRGYLGLAYDESTEAALDLASAVCTSQQDEREEVRKLLAHAAHVTMGASADEVARWWQPIDRHIAPAPDRVGISDVRHLEALTAAMRAIDYRHGGGACRDAVAAQVRWAQQLLNATSGDATKTRLLLALADLHNLAGWTSFDVGMHSVARRHFARALEQAKHVEDLSLVANVLYRMGRLHLHRGLHRDALRFFQLGQIAAQDSGCGVTVSMLCVNEAWAYGLLGDRDQAMRSVRRAEDEFARAHQADVPAWVRFFGPADLHASVGVTISCLPGAGEAELTEAINRLTHALLQRGPAMTRSRAFELTARAVAHLRAGNRDDGLRDGREAVTAAGSLRSIRPIDRLKPLQLAASDESHDGDLRDLSESIARLRTA